MCFLIFCHTNSSYIKRKNVSRERINMYKDNKKHFDESYSEGCIGYSAHTIGYASSTKSESEMTENRSNPPQSHSISPFCTSQGFSDKMKENAKEESGKQDMSFVGLTFKNDRIIGYADTKGTQFKDDQPKYDSKRERISKIFKTEKFILATYGANSFIMNEGIVFLEDWIAQNINDVEYPEDLIKKLYDYLFRKESMMGKDDTIFFIAGYEQRGVKIGIYASVNKTKLSIDRKYINDLDTVYGGANEYVQYFDNRIFALVGDEEQIKKNIEEAVCMFDEKLSYNPVGGKIMVETWKM